MTSFAITRPLTTLDTETTSLDVQDARIIEIGMMVEYPEKSYADCDGKGTVLDAPGNVLDGGMYEETCPDCRGTGRTPALEWRTLVNPGIPIPAASTEVHHITDAMVQGCQICQRLKAEHEALDAGPQPESLLTVNDGPPIEVHGLAIDHSFKPWPSFRQLATRLAKFLTNVDFAGKNTRFDLRVLQAEMDRARQPWSYDDALIIDADMLERIMEPRDLSSLYRRRCGKEPEGAHSALADVRMTAEVIEAQLALWPALPRDVRELHDLQWGDWCDSEGCFRFDKKGRVIVWFGKHRGKGINEVPTSYFDWLISGSFPASVKELARKAKLGQFPEKK
jgi:DNA polymerase III epsilon subunit-like protein